MDFPAIPPDLLQRPAVRALLTLAVATVLAVLLDVVGARVMLRIARKTESDLDDRLVTHLRRPIGLTVLFAGAWYAIIGLSPPEQARFLLEGTLVTLGTVTWVLAGMRVVSDVLAHLERHASTAVQPATRPLFDLVSRVVFFGAGVYFVMLAWRIDVTAWLASAGIVGIAVGFAAQDTLANLIAGLSIMIDRPYKIGDYLVIDGTVRGRVTAIGMRSTRMLTRDDVEVTIPNAQMASAQIVNESGGPLERERVAAVVGVSYGSDIDQVRRVLIECARACSDIVLDDPLVAPRVRFREFGDSALIIALLVWIPQPELRGKVLDELNTLILKKFRAEGIDIPFPMRTVVMQQQPVKNREEPTG